MLLVIRFLYRFFDKVNKDDIFNLSAQLAYYLLMSFLPFIIFVSSLVGMLSMNNDYAIRFIAGFLPSVASSIVLDNAQHIIAASSPSFLSISIIMTLWLASKCVRTIMQALNHAYDVEDRRNYFVNVLLSVMHTLIISIFIVLTVIVIFYSRIAQNFSILNESNIALFHTFKIILIYLLLFSALVLIYKFFPHKKIRWRDTLIGAAIASFIWIVSYYAFAYYANNIWQYSRFYGSLGAVVVFLLWMYIVSFIMLVGGEINVAVMNFRKNE